MANKFSGMKKWVGVCVVAVGTGLGVNAWAHDGVIHIVGEITAPSCNISPQSVMDMHVQMNTLVRRQVCSTLESKTINTASSYAVASIERDTTQTKQDEASDHPVLILSYR